MSSSRYSVSNMSKLSISGRSAAFQQRYGMSPPVGSSVGKRVGLVAKLASSVGMSLGTLCLVVAFIVHIQSCCGPNWESTDSVEKRNKAELRELEGNMNSLEKKYESATSHKTKAVNTWNLLKGTTMDSTDTSTKLIIAERERRGRAVTLAEAALTTARSITTKYKIARTNRLLEMQNKSRDRQLLTDAKDASKASVTSYSNCPLPTGNFLSECSSHTDTSKPTEGATPCALAQNIYKFDTCKLTKFNQACQKDTNVTNGNGVHGACVKDATGMFPVSCDENYCTSFRVDEAEINGSATLGTYLMSLEQFDQALELKKADEAEKKANRDEATKNLAYWNRYDSTPAGIQNAKDAAELATTNQTDAKAAYSKAQLLYQKKQGFVKGGKFENEDVPMGFSLSDTKEVTLAGHYLVAKDAADQLDNATEHKYLFDLTAVYNSNTDKTTVRIKRVDTSSISTSLLPPSVAGAAAQARRLQGGTTATTCTESSVSTNPNVDQGWCYNMKIPMQKFVKSENQVCDMIDEDEADRRLLEDDANGTSRSARRMLRTWRAATAEGGDAYRRRLESKKRPMDCKKRNEWTLFLSVGGLLALICGAVTLILVLVVFSGSSASEKRNQAEAEEMQNVAEQMRREKEREMKKKIEKRVRKESLISANRPDTVGSQMVGHPQIPVVYTQPPPTYVRYQYA